MSAVTDRMKSLEEMVAAQEKKLEGKIRTVIVVYAVLVLIVAAYTSFVASVIADLTSRKAVAEQVNAWLNGTLPERRQAVVDQLKDSAGTYAETSVKFVFDSLFPAIEKKTAVALDGFGQLLADEIQQELLPQFIEFIREDAERLSREYGELRDEEVGEALVTIFVDIIEQEMDKYLNERFVTAVHDLQGRIRALAKPDRPLTKKEDAQRRALVHWSYLAEHGEVGSSFYYDMFRDVKHRFGIYSTNLASGKPALGDDEQDASFASPAGELLEDFRARAAKVFARFRAARSLDMSTPGLEAQEVEMKLPEELDIEIQREKVEVDEEPAAAEDEE